MFRICMLWTALLCVFEAQGKLVAENNTTFPIFISAPCRTKWLDVEIDNVQQVFVGDKSTAIKIMQRSASTVQELSLRNRSAGVTYALNVDATITYGGFPEDLALVVSELGYDVLILRSNGDDLQASYMSNAFWRKLKCPIPVYRMAMAHQKEVMDISGRFALVADDSFDASWEQSTAIWGFLSQGVAIPMAIFWFSIDKIRTQIQTENLRSTGTLLGVTCFLQGICQMILGIQALSTWINPQSMSNPFYVTITGLTASLAITSIYVVAVQFNLVIRESRSGSQQNICSNPAMMISIAVTCIGIMLQLAGTASIAQQTASSSINIYLISYVYYFLFRLVIAVYFIWGHFHVLSLMKQSSSFLGWKGVLRIKALSVRMITTAILVIASELCILYGILPGLFYFNRGFYSVTAAMFFTGLTAITEVMTLKEKVLNSWFQKTKTVSAANTPKAPQQEVRPGAAEVKLSANRNS
jgi:hypothetical protein